MSRPFVLGIVAILLLTLATISSAQSKPAVFDVASVKLNKSGDLRSSTLFPPGGRFSAKNASLKLLIRLAYGFADHQISDGADWIKSDRFDVEAKSETNPSEVEIKEMVKGLLEDRFQLKVHRATKQDTVYALAVSRTGPKIKRVPYDHADRLRNDAWHGVKAAQGHLFTTEGAIAGLVAYLSQILDRPVIDRTGLDGVFEFDFTLPATILPSPDSSVSIFEAIQDQLGLRLEQTSGPVEFLIIDHAEKPDAN